MDTRTDVRARAYRCYVLALLVVVGVVGWVDRNVFAVLLQSVKADLALSDTQLGLLGGVAFGVFYAAVGLPVAWLADRYSRSALISVALGLWSVMTALCGLATGFSGLFLARIGVGVGEAGGSPPSQSLLADYFPPDRRARALGVLYLYIPIGFVVGYLSGGWLNELVGWRLTFLLVGLPGVLLAVVVRFTLLEPPRGHAEGARETPIVPSLAATLRYFLSRPTLRQLPLAGAVHGIGAFAAAIWLPAYFMRTFEVTSATAGVWMALAYGCGGGIGVLCGGYIADALVRRTGDSRWYAWGSAAVISATLPCTLLVYLTDAPMVAVASLIVATLFGHMFLGPVAALLQSLAGLRRRATAAAFYLFLVNLVSMGLGPVAVGIVSDYLSARLADGALRYALLAIVSTTTVLASLHFMLAARTLREDLELAGAATAHAAG
jgi:MFS family permease